MWQLWQSIFPRACGNFDNLYSSQKACMWQLWQAFRAWRFPFCDLPSVKNYSQLGHTVCQSGKIEKFFGFQQVEIVPKWNCSEVAPAFVGSQCAHGGSEGPNRAALPVTKYTIILPVSLKFCRQGGYHTFSNTDTRFAPNIFGRACFFSLRRPVRTASALDNWQIRYSAPKMEDAIIRSAHLRWRACVVRYDVAP